MAIFNVIRIVKEVASVEADTAAGAIRIVGEDGANWEVTVIKETAEAVQP